MPAENRSTAHQPRDFLFIQSTTELGGAERVLLNLFTASEELRQRSVVATLGFGQGDLPSRLRALGTEVVELKMPRMRHPWKLVPTFLALRRLARAAGARVVVGNGGHPQIVAGWTARLAGVRSLFLVHAIYLYPWRKNDPRDILALAGPCDVMLAVSQTARAQLMRLRPGVDSRVLYNGTPMLEVASEEMCAARRELGAEKGDLLIGVFGRLQRSKGQDVFVAAAGRIARLRTNVKFAVVGGSVFGFEPEYADELKRDVAAHGLADRLVFTDFREDVPRLMAACDVICSPSRGSESFGMTIVEAMALGRAVIATSVGGPSEIIADKSHGILIPPNDVGALAGAMMSLIDDSDLRRELGARGRERVRASFSIDVMASTLIRQLDDLIAAA